MPWLRRQHDRGAKLVSVCSGAFILAETGLVAGRSVCTHRICADALAKRFPEIAVDTNQRIIDHGDIITAGGFMAWVDVGLLLVDKILGRTVRAETARFVLSDPVAIEARYFAGFSPKLSHGDTAVLRAQEWAHIRDGRGASLASMAAAAGLERRTFLRRFVRATGMTPIEYCRAARIARARAPGIREHAPEGDREIPWVYGRGFICTCVSQDSRDGSSGVAEKVWSSGRFAGRFRTE
jgi:transcriptional regulator GlxA family with amidase domain